jgi:phospholipid transport system transporter-binding protein
MSEPRSVRGELTFDTVPGLYRESAAWFAGDGDLNISLREVTRADSAGLALLVEWLKQAQRGNRRIRFLDIPSQVQTLIGVNGLTDALPNSDT